MRVLVLGASGMLGHTVLRVLTQQADWAVFGTVRSESARRNFDSAIARRVFSGVDIESHDSLVRSFESTRPEVVINCVGIVKQLPEAFDPLQAILVNSLLPHRLSMLCALTGARLIHISTDCVFAGDKGGYVESDPSDAKDLYGKSKYLGEVSNEHSLTLRTSIIGHELHHGHGLVSWFLAQEGKCQGYTRTIFSGMPTVVLSQIIRDVVIPRPDLHGVYHIAAEPISKFNLLTKVSEIYGKEIEIVADDKVILDRSLDASRFQSQTGYIAPTWDQMVRLMHQNR
jgi:dTDP-4-dehydrorhamnose reductase